MFGCWWKDQVKQPPTAVEQDAQAAPERQVALA
jgi:hypothetical protein